MGVKTVTYVNSPGDMPDGPHFAIILSSQKDDGYGGSTPCIEYQAYTDRAIWEAQVAELTTAKHRYETFKAMHVKPAKLRVSVEVKVTED